MKKSVLTFLLLAFLNQFSISQVTTGTGMEIDNDKLEDLFSKNVTEYIGIYHFGESEWESNLFIFVDNEVVCGQLRYSKWKLDENDNVIGVNVFYCNLKNLKIEKYKLNAVGWTGKFVLYENEKGLIIDNSHSECEWKIENEIGMKLNAEIGVYHSGKFPEASLKILTEKDLENKLKTDLKIMRNEIFARYGYIFKSGGEMEKYFKLQDWYSEQYENVNSFLTDIEKANIELIQKIENLKNGL